MEVTAGALEAGWRIRISGGLQASFGMYTYMLQMRAPSGYCPFSPAGRRLSKRGAGSFRVVDTPKPGQRLEMTVLDGGVIVGYDSADVPEGGQLSLHATIAKAKYGARRSRTFIQCCLP